jgi:hypothetical protein
MENDKIKASISNISMSEIIRKRHSFDCPKIDNIIGDSKNYEQTITFSLNDVKPYWEYLGYKTEQAYHDSLFIIDSETGKKYRFNDLKEIIDNGNTSK